MASNRLTFEEDYPIVEAIALARNIKPKTKETYLQTIDHYTELFNQSFASLIDLYYDEEDTLVWKKRTLKQHLIQYRNYLYNHFLKSSAKIYYSKLLTILRHMEIEVGSLPKLNDKNTNDLAPICYEDLPSKDEIERAYLIAAPVMKAIILFETSTGCARRETLNLTVKDYLDANGVNEYDKPINTLFSEVNTNNVPCFKLKRQKTNKYYFTYCTPQANHEVLQYLRTRDNLKLHDPLFDLTLYFWNKQFNQINNQLHLGKVRTFNKFRSHMLRKYHASTLFNNGMSMEDIDSLQGRSKDTTRQSYFMEDPNLLKKKYVEHMDCLLLEV